MYILCFCQSNFDNLRSSYTNTWEISTFSKRVPLLCATLLNLAIIKSKTLWNKINISHPNYIEWHKKWATSEFLLHRIENPFSLV